jgi:hypothetical protein
MARRKRIGEDDLDPNVSMEDVAAMVLPEGVPQNPDGTPRTDGDVTVDQAQEIGAIDIDSAAQNKRFARTLRDKVAGKTDVAWNAEDPMQLYAGLRTAFAGEFNTMMIVVSRVEPAPRVQYPPVYASTVKDGAALYSLVEKYHGNSPNPSTYRVKFTVHGGAVRGQASLSLDGAPAATPQVQPTQQQMYPYGPPPGYPQRQEGHDPRVIVNVPPQQAAPVMAPDFRNPYEHDRIADLVASSQNQMKEMMGAFLQIVETLKKPAVQMPAGFVPLPDGYPIPPGYVALPGGCVPAPPVAQVPVQPQVVYRDAPAASHPAVPVQSSTQLVAPPQVQLDPSQQVASAVKMMSGLYKGMEEFKSLFQQQGAVAGAAADMVEDVAEETVQSAVTTTQVGDLTMAFNKKDGSTNWPATLISALPKLVDVVKGGITEYSKAAEKHHNMTQQAVQARIRLAQEVQRAQQGLQPAALPQQPPQTQPPPAVASPPVQVAPTPTNGAAVKMKKTGLPENMKPLWE